jgi:hypothetical protein
MSRYTMMALASLALFLAGSARAQKLTGPRRPTPVMRSGQAQKEPVPLTGTPINPGVNPATITFTSSTPDGTQTNGTTKVQFRVTFNPASFHVYAKAGAANFTGCNTPPMTSVTVACGTPTGVTCVASAPLSNTGNGTAVATGKGNHNPASFYITYTFQDAWNYSVGSSCQLTVSYLYTEP